MFRNHVGSAPRRSLDPAIASGIIVALPTLAASLPALLLLTPPYLPGYAYRVAARDLWTELFIHGSIIVEVLFRFGLALTCAGAAAGLAGFLCWRRTPLSDCAVSFPHDDEPKLYYDEYARREIDRSLTGEFGQDRSGGLWLVPGVRLPREIETQFLLVVGDKGSGKSNILRALASQAIARGDRVLLHCVKGDVTRSFTRTEAVLIGAHHAEGWAWDAAADLRGRAAYMDLAEAVIPASESSAFWAQAARAVFVDVLDDLAAERGKAGWTFMDLARRLIDDPQAIKARIAHIDLGSGALIEEGEDGITNTTFGVMATLWAGVLNGLRPLALAWADMPADRRFSVRAWLRGKGPRIVIIQTAPEFEQLSTMVSAMVLGRVTAGLSDPSLPVDPKRRVVLVLDELKAMGRIPRLEDALAVGREKGLVAIGALQSLTQLREVYGSDRGQIIQDLFRMRIFSRLAAGASADLASTLIGERTMVWREANKDPDKKGLYRFERATRPVISSATLQNQLGVRLVGTDPENPEHKKLRAVVTGIKDVQVLDWPLTIWRRRRRGYVPAAWMTAHPQPPSALPGVPPPPQGPGTGQG
jgi:hypothetical protein